LKQTGNYYINMSVISVSKALEKINISDGLITYIRGNKERWGTFGKKNSHLLRVMLWRMYEAFGLSNDEIFMIHFFFSVIKNRNRVKTAMDNMEQSEKSKAWYNKVYQFIDKKLVQYVSEEKNGKFAVVHLPTTMPGLDLLCTVLTYEGTDEEFEQLIGKQTFAQLNLSPELQEKNKEMQIEFWNNTVQGTRNPDKEAHKTGFVEEFYKTSAGDKYNLINIKSQEVLPKDKEIGYEESEIREWMDAILASQKVKRT